MITTIDVLTIGAILLLYWAVNDIYKYFKHNGVKLLMTDETQLPEGVEPVELDRYVPNVQDFQSLNELLLSIGAAIVVTKGKTLESLGHNPDHWRLASLEELEQFGKTGKF